MTIQRFPLPRGQKSGRRPLLQRVSDNLAAIASMLKAMLAGFAISGPNPVSSREGEIKAIFDELMKKAEDGGEGHRVVKVENLSTKEFRKLLNLRNLQSFRAPRLLHSVGIGRI